jgi:hypothetical protein
MYDISGYANDEPMINWPQLLSLLTILDFDKNEAARSGVAVAIAVGVKWIVLLIECVGVGWRQRLQ